MYNWLLLARNGEDNNPIFHILSQVDQIISYDNVLLFYLRLSIASETLSSYSVTHIILRVVITLLSWFSGQDNTIGNSSTFCYCRELLVTITWSRRFLTPSCQDIQKELSSFSSKDASAWCEVTVWRLLTGTWRQMMLRMSGRSSTTWLAGRCCGLPPTAACGARPCIRLAHY